MISWTEPGEKCIWLIELEEAVRTRGRSGRWPRLLFFFWEASTDTCPMKPSVPNSMAAPHKDER